MLKVLMGSTALILAASTALAQDTSAQSAEQSFVFRASPAPIVPFQRGVGSQIFIESAADTDYVIAGGGFALTVFDGTRDHVTLWGEGFRGFDIDDGEDFYGASFGPIFRQRFDVEHAWGAYAMIDAGATDDQGDLLLSGGVGVDYEYMLSLETVETLRLGVNGYIPLDDYSDVAEYGALDRAPQLGGDAYVRYGRDFEEEGARVDLTVGGFGYAQSDNADEVFGGVATVGLTYWNGLPQGMAIKGFVGPRYATAGDGLGNRDDKVDVLGGLGLSYSWGGERRATRSVTTQPRYDPPRDCVVARDENDRAVYDCRRPVMAGERGRAKTGEMVREIIPAPQPRVEQVEVTVPGAAPVKPVRHIGYASPFTPLKR